MSITLLTTLFLLFLLKYIDTCPDGCYPCILIDEEYKCKSCSSGYYKIEIPDSNYFNCEKCEEDNCDTCSLTPSKCSSCEIHYYFEDEICKSCSPNCLNCKDSASYCTSCHIEDYLIGSTCYDCDSNCYECIATASHC